MQPFNQEINRIQPNDYYTNFLFNENLCDTINEQISIFEKIEENIPLYTANLFENDVNFQNSNNIPIQRWFPYREGYSTNLVDLFIKEFNIKGNVFDPFSGSGTTLLSCRNNSLQSYGIDINPISVLVSNVENNFYSKKDINDLTYYYNCIKDLTEPDIKYTTLFPLSHKVFNSDILQALLHIKNFIDSIDNNKIRDLIKVSWLSIIELVSNIKKEGNGIKYKNRKRTPNGYISIDKDQWEKDHFPNDKLEYVKQQLLYKLKIIISDLNDFYGPTEILPMIYNDNCLKFDKFIDKPFELTIYSPPYCNCFDYFEIHKVELWIGKFVNNSSELKNLKQMGFRSNTNSLTNKTISYKNQYIENIINLFDIDKLWSKNIPSVIRGYFDDTNTLLEKLFYQTKHNGRVCIVVGNSAYSGVIVPTDLIIAEIAKEVGFNITGIYITRHLTTSSQQKKFLTPIKQYLRESIVILEKK